MAKWVCVFMGLNNIQICKIFLEISNLINRYFWAWSSALIIISLYKWLKLSKRNNIFSNCIVNGTKDIFNTIYVCTYYTLKFLAVDFYRLIILSKQMTSPLVFTITKVITENENCVGNWEMLWWSQQQASLGYDYHRTLLSQKPVLKICW